MSYAQSGLAVSAFALSLGLSNGPLGVLADRIGSRRVVVGGLVLTGLASLALGLVGDYPQLLFMLLVLGVVSGTYHAPSAAILARTFSARVRGTAMGVHITGGHFAFFAAPLLASYLATATGTWRTAYLWFGIAPIPVSVVLWLVTTRDPVRATGRDVFGSFREIATVTRIIGPLVSVSVLFQVFHAAVNAFLALYLVDARGVSPAIAAVAFGFTQLVGIVGAPLGGLLSDRVGRKVPIIASFAVAGPATYLLTIVPTEWILGPLALIGFAGSMRATATEVFVMDSAPAERRATILGAYYLVAQPVGGLFAPVFGAVAGAVGIATAFSAAGLALFACSVLALVLGRRL